jgi:putative salt-induced outer membrane protein
MQKKLALLLLVVGVAIARGSRATEALPEGWTTAVEFGAISTSGNTAGASIAGKIDARQELADWSNHYVVSGFFKEDEVPHDEGAPVRVRSAQQYSLSAKAALRLKDRRKKLFVLATYAGDRFGAFTKYSAISIGHSSRLYTTDRQTLDVDLGPGYFKGVQADGDPASGIIAHGSAAINWKVGTTAVFTQMLSVDRGTANIHSIAETALSTKISDTMQMKAAFTLRNDTEVPAERKNTDTQTSLTLVYSF